MRAPGLLVLLATGCASPGEPELLTCNGWEALCDRTWLELATPATHNSHASLHRGYLEPAANHRLPIPDQLAAGFRMLNVDVYRVEGEMVACHGYCDFGQQPLAEVYAEITGFLDTHPREAIWLVLQDGAPLDSTLQAFVDAGMDERAWVLDGSWPTLRAMIDADRRLILAGRGGGEAAPWYAADRDLKRGTDYGYPSWEVTDCDASLDPELLFEVSHTFLDPLAFEALSEQGNPHLMERMDACIEQHGRVPNILAVDWFEHGDAVGVAAALNGVAMEDRQTPWRP